MNDEYIILEEEEEEEQNRLEANRLHRVRRALGRHNLRVRKSRAWKWNADNYGGYQIRNDLNDVVFGDRYSLELDELEAWTHLFVTVQAIRVLVDRI